MKPKIFSFFKEYWKKLVLICFLGLSCALFDKLSFNSLEYLIRDSLQYLNSPDSVDKSIVTLNINTYSKYGFQYPHKLDTFKTVIDKLQESKPRFILIMMEPLDLLDTVENKKAIFDYLVSQKNVYLNKSESRNDITSFEMDTVFKNYPYFINFVLCRDEGNKKNRREIITYNNKGPPEIVATLKLLGLNPKNSDYFKYSWDYWETKQAYIKSYKLGTFGNYQTDNLFNNSIPSDRFTDKIVIIGTHDEYSYLARGSIFNNFISKSEKNMRAYVTPFQDTVAGIINLYTTGNYVKFLSSAKDMYFVFFFILFLILSKINNIKKLYIYLSLIPTVLIFQVFLYLISSFYIDFSKSIAFLFFTQYFALPIAMFLIFRGHEKQKLIEINDARIDSLLLISERVAHDIRSPLSAINIVLSRLQIENLEYKEIISSSLKRIDETVDKLLTKYKAIPTKNLQTFEKIPVKKIIELLVSEKKMIGPKIKFHISHTQSAEIVGLGYRIELEQIISNILDNSIYALQSIAENPEIFVNLSVKNEHCLIEIEDNGIGIPTEVLSLIGHERVTTKQNEKGNGIALLHAKRTIERMHGRFEIESKEKLRTSVTILLKNVHQSDTGS